MPGKKNSSSTIKGKIESTMSDMKAIGTALEYYISDNNKAPEARTIEGLVPLLVPFYIRTLPKNDAWGNQFYYIHGAGENQGYYAIGSGGSDGKFDGFEQEGVYTELEGKDIIYSNGKFIFGPDLK